LPRQLYPLAPACSRKSLPRIGPRTALSYVREGLIRGQNRVADGREAGSESEQESTIFRGGQLLIGDTNRDAGGLLAPLTNSPRKLFVGAIAFGEE
jgi:hypothetical protein